MNDRQNSVSDAAQRARRDIPPRGEYLDNVAAAYGLRRRFFGLEPAWMLRARITKLVRKHGGIFIR